MEANRVLIVDDALIIRKRIKDIAEEVGWQVAGEAGDGVEALLQRIEKSLLHGQQEIELVLAPEAGRARAWLHQNGDVTGERTEDDGASHLVVRLSVERLGQFKAEFPGLLPAAS